jgi:Predicted acetyltransferase
MRRQAMFSPFVKEALSRESFLKSEVQFNLFHRMLEGDLDIALMMENNMIALHGSGRPMWLWINEKQGKKDIEKIIDELSRILKDKNLYGISASPDISKLFAKKYSDLIGITYELSMCMESYHCPDVKRPKNVLGKMIPSLNMHTRIVAEYCAGFSLDGFGNKVTVDSQISSAERLISSGNLYLWTVNDMVVSMANIAHRSPRHARINSVYTPPGERKKGYASALVAELGDLILKEDLTPILFADVKNPDSNKVYKNIGSIETGKILECIFNY